jgi:hypothetical protein
LEIFEAGTGHGSLTLALARAVHAGNSHLKTPVDSDGEWKKRRSAVIHSLDISEKHSLHACTVVHGFRRGMYSRSFEFYVGDPTQWMLRQSEERGLATTLPPRERATEAEIEVKGVDERKGSSTLFS